MSEPAKAVFLSYASQDAAAAKRICDALRAAGVEVWFDQSELVGGDAWDAKIRRQIKECALFVPLISAHTQARGEGYFRLEWKLAVDRSHLMAEDTAFLFPVVIDDVPNAAARVPDRFREVQWTRLRLDETPTELAGRVAKLLRNEGPGDSAAAEPAPRSGRARARRPGWVRLAWGLLGLTCAGLLLLQPMGRAPRAQETPPAAPAQSEARQLVAKAQQMFLALDSTRDDFALAEDVLKQAVAKAPDDAEVWAAFARLHERYSARGWDPSGARRDVARQAVRRALRLDPGSFEARFAEASLFTGTSEKDRREHERALRALLKERPDDKRVIRALASVLRYLPDRGAEIIELYDRAAQLPGGDPLALYDKALACWFMGRLKEADAAVTASLAQQPFTSARLLAAYFAAEVDGDLAKAKRLLEELPAATLQDDRGCFIGYLIYTYRDEPDQARALVRAFPRDWINDSWYHGPKGLLMGNVLSFAARPEAAAIEWRAALKLVDARLADAPNNLDLLGTRLELLAKLGDQAAARPLYRAVREMLQAQQDGEIEHDWYIRACVAMGERAEALRIIAASLGSKQRVVYFPASDLRHNPEWKSLRGDPGFIRLLAEADRLEQADKGAADVPAAVDQADPESVAVLAFTNLSDDKQNEYFSDGISEELLTVLQRIPGLHVAARTSSFSFKGSSATAQEIGQKLGVATLVEGSVRKAGRSVRITARLSRAATGEQVWSESYTRELQDVFAVQSELAETIVSQLRGQLGGDAAKAEIQAQVSAAEKGGTRLVEAHELYLQGKYLLNRASMPDARRAEEVLRQAVQLDPNFVLGWAALSETGWLMANLTAENRTDFEAGCDLARKAADKAISLGPNVPAALRARFDVQSSLDWNWNEADATLRRMQVSTSSDSEVLFRASGMAFVQGQPEQAVDLGRRAVALDPVNPVPRIYLGYFLLAVGRLEESGATFQKLTDLNPSVMWAYAGESLVHTLQGRFAEAISLAERAPVAWARQYALALARWGAKDRVGADEALDRLTQTAADVAVYQIATVYAYRGEADRAFEWLQRARRQRDVGATWSKSDVLLANLHSDPRWNGFLQDMGLTDAQLK